MKTIWQGTCNDSLNLLKSAEKHFYPSFSSVRIHLSYKNWFLVRSEVLDLLVNQLTANYVYSRRNTDKLPPPVEMQLSEKQEPFSGFFILFSEAALNFKHFKLKKRFWPQVSLK